MSGTAFLQARDFLLANANDYEKVVREFTWPVLDEFNWAIDHFDRIAEGNRQPALLFANADGIGAARTYADLRSRSNQLANLLRSRGAVRGDRLLLMLPNVTGLWETMLAAFKLGIVVIPATPQLTRADIEDRFARGGAKHVVTDVEGSEKIGDLAADGVRLLIGGTRQGWGEYSALGDQSQTLANPGVTKATDPLLLYFTSGTTAKPKLVIHSHQSYPVGHLTTMFWIGARPGDRHLNISSPGWAKHAYSSFFAPWSAGATIVVFDAMRVEPRAVLGTLRTASVSTFCAPPTLWRMLINEDLPSCETRLREVMSAGEPLNPEVIERVQDAWGLTIREGYGQTETTILVGSFPGQVVKPGSMGQPAPGFDVSLRPTGGADATDGQDGEISIALEPRPLGVMDGYLDDPARMASAVEEGFYRTGDVAVRDGEGFYTYVGRADDVFKSAGYRISPFELESVMIEHPAVAEAAIVESPDPVRMVVPKAFIALRGGFTPSRELAADLFRFIRGRCPGYQRIRRLEFAELPKTISGKIRRVELRLRERDQVARGTRSDRCFWDDDFPELRTPSA